MDTNNTEVTGKRPNRILQAFNRLGARIYEVFKDYPAAMIAIIFAAFLGAVLEGDSFLANDYEDQLEKIIGFFLIFSYQALMYEEVFKKKIIVRISGYVASAVLSFIFVYIFSNSSDLIFNVKADTVKEISARILCVYSVVMTGIAVYHMFRRLEEDFEVYCTRAFLELMKATFVYGLFAIGLGIIVFIFNELIFDTDDFVWQLELFLAGGIYTPMCIKAVSGKNDPPGRFAKLCILYVLQPMLLIAFAIIYIYIVKIFVTDSVPSNQVFDILAFLFSIGMPVWTMVHAVMNSKDDDMEQVGTRKGWARISPFVPYVFIPFIALQCWSMGIRIKDYGFTVSRYSAMVLVVVEVIYSVLYLIHHRGNKRAISWILFALMGVTFLAVLMPGLSYDDVVIRSQTKRIEQMLDGGKLTDKEKASIKSAYRAIDRVGYKGEDALEKRFTKAQIKEIQEYSDYYEWHRNTIYPYYSNKYAAIDVSDYSRISYAHSKDNKDEYGDYVITMVGMQTKNGGEQEYDVDLSELVEWLEENCNKENARDIDLAGRDIYRIDGSTDFCITYMNMTYNLDSEELEHVSIEGFVLEK